MHLGQGAVNNHTGYTGSPEADLSVDQPETLT